MSLLNVVRETVERNSLLQPGELVVVGVSGGPDSICLLAVLRELAPEYGLCLHVGHLDHGIRPESAQDACVVQDLCARWGIKCSIRRVDVPRLAQEMGRSLEEAARVARYAFLAELAAEVGADTVAVGHHADDQAETVLMHLLRGAGLAGLSGMRPLSLLNEERPGSAPAEAGASAALRLIRPLLSVTRAQVAAYVATLGVTPVEDITNDDPAYLRNRLRHVLLPALESYNPNIRAALCRTAAALAGESEIVERAVQDAWERTVVASEPERVVFSRALFAGEPVAMQRALVRRGVHHLCATLRDLGWDHVQGAVDVAVRGGVGSRATLPAGLMLAVGYDRLLLARQEIGWPSDDRPRVSAPIPVRVPGDTALPDGTWGISTRLLERAALPADWSQGADPYSAWLDADRLSLPLMLRPRRSGDQIQPLGMQGSQSIKELMIDHKVPVQERDTVPLLVSAEDVAWVVGLRVSAGYAITDETRRVLHVRLVRTGIGEDT